MYVQIRVRTNEWGAENVLSTQVEVQTEIEL